MNEKTLNTYGAAMSKGDRITGTPKTPKQIVLTVTIGASRTYGYIDDACGLAGAKGLVSANDGTAFDVAGSITPTNVKEFLKSYAIVVGFYNLNASVAADLANNLETITTNLDGTYSNDSIFSSLSVSNMQYNADLLNVMQSFLWTNNVALKLDGTTGTVYSITLGIRKIVPYGQLEQYFAENPTYQTL